MIVSPQQMAAVFNEWARQYSLDPDAFGKILDENGKPYEDYGSTCTAEFERIFKDLTHKP